MASHITSMRPQGPDLFLGVCSCGWTTQVAGTARQVDEALKAHVTAAKHIEEGQ